MTKGHKQTDIQNLPACAAKFIKLVIQKMRYRRNVREEVQAELAGHFEDEIKDCPTDKEKEQKARQLVGGFGDVKLLAILLRRAKKRCRPMWRKAVVRAFQTVGVLILCFILYTIWFLSGKPTVRVDYLAQLNQIAQPQVSDEDNAWPHYKKAIELFVEPGDVIKEMASFSNDRKARYRSFGSLTELEQQEIRKWVEQNQAAWQEFLAASLKSYCYRKYKRTDDKGTVLFNIDLSHLQPLRGLARLGTWRTLIEMERGQTPEALENCLVVARVGRHWQGKGAVVEQLVGMLIENSIVQTTFAFLDEKQISAELLNNFQNKLEDIMAARTYTVDFQVKRFFYRDAIQHCFTDDGKGSGHLIPGKMEEFGFTSKAHNHVLKDIAYSFGLNGHKVMAYPSSLRKALISANRREVVRKFETACDKYESWAKMTPWQMHSENIDFEPAFEKLSHIQRVRYTMFYNLMPASQHLIKYSHKSKAQTEALVATLAVLRYKENVGYYPENLEELITAGYVKKLPMDPYSDKPLVYKKTVDSFVLYSLGPDFDDDGGVENPEDSQKRRQEGPGDEVFWPVPKSEVKPSTPDLYKPLT